MNKIESKIDFVVLWVNPSDKEWQKQRAKYSKIVESNIDVDDREERYRDWDLFKYWFRGVEKFAPWVNKVHLVTCGHVPEWLNRKHPKLHIVNHSDFMPKEALPTFNSNAIELCIHKITGLAEQFVLFNDDLFVTKPVKPSDFFIKGRPVNTMTLFATMPSLSGQSFYKVVNKNIAIINKYYNYGTFKKKNIFKILSPKQKEWIIFSMSSLFYNQFIGFRDYHIANSYLKKTLHDVWDKEPGILQETVMSRFRDNGENVNHWLFNYWQFASGVSVQRNAHFGKSFFIDNEKNAKYIHSRKYHVICINDRVSIERDKSLAVELKKAFEDILPDKSEYEL